MRKCPWDRVSTAGPWASSIAEIASSTDLAHLDDMLVSPRLVCYTSYTSVAKNVPMDIMSVTANTSAQACVFFLGVCLANLCMWGFSALSTFLMSVVCHLNRCVRWVGSAGRIVQHIS